jgi:hypothetical protein
MLKRLYSRKLQHYGRDSRILLEEVLVLRGGRRERSGRKILFDGFQEREMGIWRSGTA